MADQPKFTRKKLTLARRIVSDGLYFARPNYIASAERLMQLDEVIAARQMASPKPSWAAIITKAFALAANEYPQMRQVFLEFPWGHIGQYESQVGSVVINRQIDGEDAVFLATLPNPENQSLLELDAALHRYQEAPIEQVGAFRTTVRNARLPRLLGRFLLWLALHVFPRRRACFFGTFTVSTLCPFGAKSVVVPTVGNPVLHYGVINEAGEMPVSLIVDHRVMDGAVVGFTLMEMEQALRHTIRDELLAMSTVARAA